MFSLNCFKIFYVFGRTLILNTRVKLATSSGQLHACDFKRRFLTIYISVLKSSLGIICAPANPLKIYRYTCIVIEMFHVTFKSITSPDLISKGM